MNCSIEELRKIPEFAQVPQDQLDWLRLESNLLGYSKGDFLFKKGEPINNMYLMIEGRVEIKVEQNGQYRHIAFMEPDTIGGTLPYSRATIAQGYGEVIENCKVLAFAKAKFKELTQHYELTESLVHHMTSRVREFTKVNVQQEKMMALGKLSAGLAHELNNPSSAMRRSAIELKKNLSLYPEKFKTVMTMRLTEEQVDPVNETIFSRLESRPENKLSLMERTEQEDDLADWLEEKGVEDGYELAETLVDYCMGIETMEEVYDIIGERDFAGVAAWISNVLTTEKMVNEIEEASQRIEELVTSVKGYTHMDRAPEKTPADVHKGLDNTLIMLKHKLKKNSVEVIKDYCEDCPQPSLYVSEINQVWTNLIDNAIDAMENGGELTIRTYYDKDIFIEIKDTGHGIPEELIDQIFDPFFTTKAIGKGTGMGLEVSQRIIDQHNGRIQVSSSKDGTTFEICLPIA
ncbi:histidine kinase/DNA gyrase B/HSP90-like ATPase [Nonlabens dokdonensis]|uniref:histidine kinase n=2 Tax=Nonlabens dokdonensis TaxID=328515 RepID=L7WB93_NONDD|nr:ATP-binding protein [Nonlabens dokdonensis]AGC77359.1 sensor protein [Nonlabens dokdonensis DSW-6]PZX40885.1 histidine kinase/DNA gyrase B/HSP90-like ATPase [Nonlabens dokdonensis]